MKFTFQYPCSMFIHTDHTDTINVLTRISHRICITATGYRLHQKKRFPNLRIGGFVVLFKLNENPFPLFSFKELSRSTLNTYHALISFHLIYHRLLLAVMRYNICPLNCIVSIVFPEWSIKSNGFNRSGFHLANLSN